MSLTLHQKEALLNHEYGLTFSAIISFSAMYDKTFAEAIEIAYEAKVNGRSIDPLTGDLIVHER